MTAKLSLVLEMMTAIYLDKAIKFHLIHRASLSKNLWDCWGEFSEHVLADWYSVATRREVIVVFKKNIFSYTTFNTLKSAICLGPSV